MKTLSLVLFLVFLQGCASGQINSRYEEHKTQLEDARHKTLVPESDPLVTEELLTPAYQKGFVERECGKGKLSKKAFTECNGKLQAQVYACLNLKYPQADGTQVMQRCTAYPTECHDGATLEKWARESHNKRVNDWYDAKLVELGQWRDGAISEMQYRDSMAMQNAGNSLTGLSKQLSGPKPTQCQSRPDGMGGVTTQCSP